MFHLIGNYSYYAETIVVSKNDIESLNKILYLGRQAFITFYTYGTGGLGISPAFVMNSVAQKAIAWFNARDNQVVRYLAVLANDIWTIKAKTSL